MEKLLSALLPMNDEKKKSIWGKCIFVLDANILLNQYKYSAGTREEFIKILEKIKNRLWIPHQVALEYLYNRTKKIHEQEKEFEEHIKALHGAKDAAINTINSKLDNIKKPFRKCDIDDLTKKINDFFTNLETDIKNLNKDAPDFKVKDIILDIFIDFFNERIGAPFSNEDLEQIHLEGEKRYSDRIPPGYEDAKEKKGQYKLYDCLFIKSEFGDLIIWKQLINKAKEVRKPIVFITDDRKEDWWRKENGQIKGPRYELINEFTSLTEQPFLMYSAESFLENAKTILSINVPESAIEEVKSYSYLDKNIFFRNLDEAFSDRQNKHYNEDDFRYIEFKNEKEKYNTDRYIKNKLIVEKHRLNKELEDKNQYLRVLEKLIYEDGNDMKHSDNDKYQTLKSDIDMLELDIKIIKDKIDDINRILSIYHYEKRMRYKESKDE